MSKYHLGLVEKRYGSSQNQCLTTYPENTCSKYTLEFFGEQFMCGWPASGAKNTLFDVCVEFHILKRS